MTTRRRRAQKSSPKLRDALGHDELVGALRAAWSPSSIDERAHAEMLDDRPSWAEELAPAAKLRDGLEHDPLMGALRAAFRPAELDGDEHRAIVARALAPKVVRLPPRRMRAVVVATTIVALAACMVLWFNRPSEQPLAHLRSTQPLFDEPFKEGETSARIDRIALARASDYRDNRFAQWGVR